MSAHFLIPGHDFYTNTRGSADSKVGQRLCANIPFLTWVDSCDAKRELSSYVWPNSLQAHTVQLVSLVQFES